MLNLNKCIVIFSCFAIENAFAAQEAAKANMGGSMIMFAVLIAGMYFLMIRPQNKRAKEHRNLLASIAKDDEVVTTGGLLGKVTKVIDQFFVLTIADGVEVVVQKQAVALVLPKNTLKSLA